MISHLKPPAPPSQSLVFIANKTFGILGNCITDLLYIFKLDCVTNMFPPLTI